MHASSIPKMPLFYINYVRNMALQANIPQSSDAFYLIRAIVRERNIVYLCTQKEELFSHIK